MANNNNIYANAAFAGCFAGMLQGKSISDPNAAAYTALQAAASAQAAAIDALIPEDALVSVGGGDPTQLAPTTGAIAANQEFRAGSLKDLCRSVFAGKYTTNPAVQSTQAAAIVAAWNAGLAGLVTP